MNNNSPSPAPLILSPPAKEVDFYRNPTELFRWINYRRWEGAQKRAESCPEEVVTWIVSTDPNTNAIQWRHLPLHLCCLQSEVPISLVETLLKLHPEAAEMEDHDGRTPLHLACLKAGITEQLTTLLLAYNPGAAVTTDRNNCTPLDLLQQSISTISSSTHLHNPAQLLQRMENFLTNIKQNVRNAEIKRVDQLHASVASERVASQQIINRLEEELASTKRTLEELESDINAKDDLEGNFEQKLLMITKENNQVQEQNQSLRQAVKEMSQALEAEKDRNSRQDEIVESVKMEYQKKIDELDSKVKNSQADTATAKSMLEALESQLKVKFTSDHAQIQKIADLESTLSETVSKRNQMESDLKSKVDILHRENVRLKEAAEKTSSYNTALQDKVKELNESLSNIISSQNILSTEQERSMEAAETYARETLEVVNAERDRLLQFVEAQRRQMEDLFAEQLRVLEAGATTGVQQRDAFLAEKERSAATMQKMRQHFKDAEAAEALRKQQEAALRSTSKIPLAQLSLNASPPTPSPTAMRSPRVTNNSGFIIRRGGGDSSPVTSSSRTVLINNPGGSRLVQNPSQSSSVTGNLSRVFERRSLEFSGSEMEDYSDDEGDEESESSGDEESSSVQVDEGNWVRTPNGHRSGLNISPGGSNNPAYNNAMNRSSRNNVSNTGQLLYSSPLRKGVPPTSPVTHHNGQFNNNMRATNDSILASNLRRGGVHGTAEQRHETVASGRKQVQYTEF